MHWFSWICDNIRLNSDTVLRYIQRQLITHNCSHFWTAMWLPKQFFQLYIVLWVNFMLSTQPIFPSWSAKCNWFTKLLNQSTFSWNRCNSYSVVMSLCWSATNCTTRSRNCWARFASSSFSCEQSRQNRLRGAVIRSLNISALRLSYLIIICKKSIKINSLY